MIDNYAEAMNLIEKMKAQLPMFAFPTEAVVQSLRQTKPDISTKQALKIEDVLYLGDEGGIACAIYLPEQKAVTVTSLTQLRIPADHPLAAAIEAYQTKRVQKLAGVKGSGKPARFTVKPRRKRKKR